MQPRFILDTLLKVSPLNPKQVCSPAQACWLFRHWSESELCYRPWRSSCSRSTECRQVRQTRAISRLAFHQRRCGAWRSTIRRPSTRSYSGRTRRTTRRAKEISGWSGNPATTPRTRLSEYKPTVKNEVVITSRHFDPAPKRHNTMQAKKGDISKQENKTIRNKAKQHCRVGMTMEFKFVVWREVEC